MIAIEGLGVRQGAFALDGVSFAVPAGAHAVLTGRTGSGKTTLLETVAGLRRLTAGRVILDGRDVTIFPPAARNVGYVPQDAVVFPTMTVRENLAFALTVRKTPVRDIDTRVGELADRLGLTGILGRRAVGLSGGEAQRVALGRALAFRPAVLLLDEPLNAVDEATRARILDLLGTLRRDRRTTVLHVTHNRADVELLGDHVLHLDGGRVLPASGGANVP